MLLKRSTVECPIILVFFCVSLTTCTLSKKVKKKVLYVYGELRFISYNIVNLLQNVGEIWIILTFLVNMRSKQRKVLSSIPVQRSPPTKPLSKNERFNLTQKQNKVQTLFHFVTNHTLLLDAAIVAMLANVQHSTEWTVQLWFFLIFFYVSANNLIKRIY